MSLFNKYHFRGQQEGEQILFVLRRHWFDILQQFFILVILLLILLGGFVLIPPLFPHVTEGSFDPLFLFLQTLFLLFLWIQGFLIWVDYYLDVWIITSERVVGIDQRGLFVRHVSEMPLARVQDVTNTVRGFFPTILNYGNLHIQSAGEDPQMIFRNVSDPYQVRETIMRLHRAAHEKKKPASP